MITSAFFNNKGGVGKSSGVINVAHALTKLGKRVLVVDCDSQRNTFRFFSDGDKPEASATRYENLDILKGAYRRTNNSGDKSELAIPRDYDYALLDMPPALDQKTKSIISLSDYVFVPIELGTFAIQGIANVTEAIDRTGAAIVALYSLLHKPR